MTEKVLNILKRQGKNICCIFDGRMLENLSNMTINKLLTYVRQMGSIRKATAVFSHQIKSEEYEFYINQGISPVIVSSDEDVYLALDGMDAIISKQVAILCLGLIDATLLPVIIAARETSEIMLIINNEEDIKSCLPYADYLIKIEDLLKE